MLITSLDGRNVQVPKAAETLARKAEQAGWQVVVTTAKAQAVGSDLEPLYEVRYEERSDEEGGGRRQVVTDTPRISATVAVRCKRGADYVFALWNNGAFDFACRPSVLQMLSSTEVAAHVIRPLDEHRRINNVCIHHLENCP